MFRTDIPVSAASCSIVSWLAGSAALGTASSFLAVATRRSYEPGQLPAKQLARLGARQPVDQLEGLGDLEAGQPLRAERPQCLGVRVGAVARDHGGDQRL